MPNWNPEIRQSVREVVFSPEGAAVNSQGREPLDAEQAPTQSPEGATVTMTGEALLSPDLGFG